MISVIVNTVAVILGSTAGLLVNKGIPKKITNAVMMAIGLCTLYIGISGTLSGNRPLVLISSMTLGVAIGTALDIDGKINRLGEALSSKFQNSKGNIAQGFASGSILFCVGAMTIVGSLEAGLTGNNDTIFTKSFMDFISSMMLSVSLGIGVMFASASVFVIQGAIVLLAHLVSPFLSEAVINEISCCGSLLITALGLNLIGVTKIKIADFLPAIILVPIMCLVKFF